MYHRPAFVTNSSSSGFYFFIPKNKEIYPEFFDEVGLTPIYDEQGIAITKDSIYEDFIEEEQEPRLEDDYPTIEELRQDIRDEICLYKEDKIREQKDYERMKEMYPDDESVDYYKNSISNFWKRSIKARSKLIGIMKRGYKILHIAYSDDWGGHSAIMDRAAGHGRIVDKKDVGGFITFSYH
jgi:hypothetical protein